MSRKTKTPAELATDFVADSFETAKSAFGGETAAAQEGFDALNKAASTYQARFSDLQAKSLEIAESNAKATFAFLRDVMTVKSPDAFVSLQQSFFKLQSEAAMSQAQDLNAMTVALMRDVASPLQANVGKAFAAFQPKQAA